MATRYEQVPDVIKLYVDDPREPAKELGPDDRISKHFNIDHIEDGLILIYPVPKEPPTEPDSYLVENWDTETLRFFKERHLKLDDDDFAILRKEKIAGLSFLDMSKDDFKECGLKIGPATLLAKEVRTLKEKPKRAFFSYKSLKEVLTEYGIDGNGIGTIRQFPPATYKLEDDDEELVHCIKEIKRRLGNMGSILADSNEVMRCEYILTILHASLYIVKRITSKELTLAPQLEVVGKLHQVVMGLAQNLIQCESALQANKKNRKRKSGEAFGEDFDYIYGIVTTASEWYFILFISDGISSTSKDSLNIRFSESALKEVSEEEKVLRKNVKRIIEVIVG
ncbi:hypothetical protein RhiirA1_463616 [Rhizophagus irregularis]|uniref:SAM domain-containing protein n=1 Tax=Rhizophagus irregularis TaxID=588596 RepID=A0A2N0RJS3_9GLOM|nr:hypothetical protein RhiirA1_463616 [Rhizophagus irregularis]